MRNQHAQRFTRAVSFLFFRCLPIADFAHSRLLTEVADRSFMKCEFPSLKSISLLQISINRMFCPRCCQFSRFLAAAISRIPRFVGYTSSLSTHVPHRKSSILVVSALFPIVNPLGGRTDFPFPHSLLLHHPAQAPFSQYRYQQLPASPRILLHRHAHSRVLRNFAARSAGRRRPRRYGRGLEHAQAKRRRRNPRQRSASPWIPAISPAVLSTL